MRTRHPQSFGRGTHHVHRKAGVIALGVALLFQLPASASAAIDAAERNASIDAILERLLHDYVLPDVAKEMDRAVRARREAGEYDQITDGHSLASRLVNDLREVSHDRHLSVRYSESPIPERIEAEDDRRVEPDQLERAIWENYGFQVAERLPGNIGYLKLNAFFIAIDEARDTATAAMTLLSNVDGLIIDLRDNGGGDPRMVAHITSYLYGDEPVHLNSLYFRPSNETTEFWTDPKLPGKKMPDVDLYILTSTRTFSAAEEFTYNLRALERATIVGETTGGGAHPGGIQRANDHFMVWVPTGRAINPITGTNWEGTGVEPHVSVHRTEAKETALIMALEKRLDSAEGRARDEIQQALRDANRKLADIEIEREDAEN